MERLIMESLAFQKLVNDFNIDRDYDELYYKNSRENYDRIVKRLSSIELPDVDSFLYTNLTMFEILDILEYILNKVLGDKFNKQVRKLAKKIILDKRNEVYSGYTYMKFSPFGCNVKEICISDDLVSLEIVTLAHEYMHALLCKYINIYDEVLTNFHYDELLSILVEYIVCYEINKVFRKDKLVDKNVMTRIKMLKNAHENLKEAKEQGAIDDILDYINHTVYGYTVSDVYANRLMDIYLDENDLVLDIRRILMGKYSIGDMLEDYNVSLEDDKTVDSFVKKLDKYDKIKM